MKSFDLKKDGVNLDEMVKIRVKLDEKFIIDTISFKNIQNKPYFN